MTVQRIRTTVEVLRGDGKAPSVPPAPPVAEEERPSLVVDFHPAEGSDVPPPPVPARPEPDEVRLDLREGIDGADVHANVEVDLARALYGGNVQLMVHTTEECPACRGDPPPGGCRQCRGAEIMPRSRLVQVVIPPRLADGSTLRVPGQGEPGLSGGRSGDLQLIVRIRRHQRFRVSGHDLVVPLPVPVPDAILGGPVPLSMPDGSLLFIHVPAGCQSGWRLRLRNLGLERDGEVGDLFADVQLALPARVEPGLRALAEAMRRFYLDDEDGRLTMPAPQQTGDRSARPAGMNLKR